MSRRIKNVTLGEYTCPNGEIIQSLEVYTIPEMEYLLWANDSVILNDILNDQVEVHDDNGIIDLDPVKQLNFIKGLSIEVDSDGRQVTKSAATQKGWRYLAHPIEVETSKLDGCFAKDWQGSDRGDFTLKFYDVNGVELVAGTQTELDTDCVKTQIIFKPDYDLDIIGGNVHQHTTPTEDIRMWVVAGAIELGALGVREFVGGVNFKFITPGTEVNTDGRASARLNKTTTGVPYNTNQMQFTFCHPAGHNHQLMIVVEYFRA